jgi:hypothetical protein
VDPHGCVGASQGVEPRSGGDVDVMRRRWSRLEVMTVIGAQFAGLATAFFCFWIAMFALPAKGLFGQPNPLVTRLAGALASVGVGLGTSAGCWAVYHLRKSRLALGGGLVLIGAVAVVAVGWAFQLGLG